MDIYIKGERLETANPDTTITWRDVRFCENVIGDAVSTDFDVPLTPKNRRLLELYGELYDGHPRRVEAVAYLGTFMRDCSLEVCSIDGATATCTLYISQISTLLEGVMLNDIIPDDSSTLLRWHEDTSIGNFPSYVAEKGNVAGLWKRHPVADFLTIANAITASRGVTIDISDVSEPMALDYSVICTGKRICPTNKIQVLLGIAASGQDQFSIFGGQHIVNDLDCKKVQYASGMWVPEDYAYSIVFNRNCKANIVTQYAPNMQGGALEGWEAEAYINGNPINIFEHSSAYIKEKTTNGFSFSKGDVLTIEADMTVYDKTVMVMLEYTDYEIEESDYGNTLNYLPVSHDWSDYTNNPYIGNFTDDHSTWSFSYFGIFCNLPPLSVKSWLTTLAWCWGVKIVRNENDSRLVKFTTLTDVDVEVERMQVEKISTVGELAKVNYVGWDNDVINGRFTAEGDALEESKDIFKSEFKMPGVTRDGRVWLPIYEVELEESGDSRNWKCNYTDFDGVIAVLIALDGIPTLMPPHPLSMMGLSDFGNFVQIEGWTFNDLTNADNIIVDGVKFAIVEVEFDTKDNTYHYTAVKLKEAIENNVIAQVRKLIGFKSGSTYYILGEQKDTDKYNLIGE